MNAFCPECETELDPTTGICPACRWDPEFSLGYTTVRTPRDTEGSITDRYRGTAYDLSMQFEDAVHVESNVSRGRMFVILGLVAGAVLYGVVLTTMANM
jgi:hypothetical protein